MFAKYYIAMLISICDITVACTLCLYARGCRVRIGRAIGVCSSRSGCVVVVIHKNLCLQSIVLQCLLAFASYAHCFNNSSMQFSVVVLTLNCGRVML